MRGPEEVEERPSFSDQMAEIHEELGMPDPGWNTWL